jgi:hypothetical protein
MIVVRADILMYAAAQPPSPWQCMPRNSECCCPEFIEEHIASWIQVSKDTKRIIVIGLAVNEDDDQIWGTLAQSTAPLYYVGGRPSDGETFLDWTKCKRPSNAHALADPFESALPKIANLLSR